MIDASILVFGMGRVGEGAYDELVRRRSHVVLGFDRGNETVARHADEGRSIVRGDALDTEFWDVSASITGSTSSCSPQATSFLAPIANNIPRQRDRPTSCDTVAQALAETAGERSGW